MSCGDGHGFDCREAMERLDEYLDHEVHGLDEQAMAAHLRDCPPCHDEFGVELEVKHLVARCCNDHAPEQLRAKVVAAIVSARIRISPAAGAPRTGDRPAG